MPLNDVLLSVVINLPNSVTLTSLSSWIMFSSLYSWSLVAGSEIRDITLSDLVVAAVDTIVVLTPPPEGRATLLVRISTDPFPRTIEVPRPTTLSSKW